MNPSKLFSIIIIAASSVLGVAQAAIYSNTNDSGDITYFGSPDTTNYGRTFTISANSTLTHGRFLRVAAILES
jgi:hypothetical protein